MRLINEDDLAVITIWQEARGEPYLGKLAVAFVVRNRMVGRVASDGSVSGTVLVANAFSGWNQHDPNRIPSLRIDGSDNVVGDCRRAWVESATAEDPTGGATDYFAPSRHSIANGSSFGFPGWAAAYTKTCEIGNHWFFKRPKE